MKIIIIDVRRKYMLKRFKFLMIFALITLCFVGSIMGQDLSDLYGELETNNYELLSLDKQSEAIILGADQYPWLPDPEFGIGAFPLPVETRLGSQLFRLSANQMIPNKGISSQRKINHELTAQPIHASKDVKVLEMRAALQKNWLEIYKIEKTKEIIFENIELLESLEKIALSKVESGKGRMSEVLIIQIKKKDILDQIKILDAKKEIPVNNINRILNREDDQAIVIKNDLDFPILNLDQNEVISQVTEQHPSIIGINYQKQIAKSKIQLNEINQKPVFGVGLDYIYVSGRNDAEPNWNGRDILQLRASVKIPINKKPYAARDKENLLKIEAWDLEEKNVQQNLIQKIKNALQEYEMARLNHELAEEQIKTTRAAIKLLESEYSSLNSGFENLITLEMSIISYEKKLLESIVNAHKAISIIEHLSL